MFANFNDITAVDLLAEKFAVCICGAGPAGITLARKLSSHGKRVLLLEAGGLEYSIESQDFYKGENVGEQYYPLDITRLRYFGGTSNHWGGWCRWLDDYDFESRAFEGLMAWPIGRKDLDFYATETQDILDLSTPDFDSQSIEAFPGYNQILFQYSWPPTRFGEKYHSEIASSDNILCLYNANVTDIRINTDNGQISSLTLNALDRSRKASNCYASAYVLAAGGIENPGIMLNANDQIPSGIGNQFDNVGRFFQEHLTFNIGEYIVNSDDDWGVWLRFLAPTPENLQAQKSLNIAFRLLGYKQEPASIKRYAKDLACSNSLVYELFEALYKAPYCEDPAKKMSSGPLEVAWEQRPNKNSRVHLGNETDEFGRHRLSLDWKISSYDIATLRASVRRLIQQSLEGDFLRLKLHDWVLDEKSDLPGINDGYEVGGHHHMCTTRMANNSRHGVVDKNCQVFNHPNLYVAGSSSFSRGGHANPTYTIVQLALRLGDHLNAIM